ncbi:MAG: 3-hydroxybutyrate dehydrogenase, partial [Acidimicrobiales bacterium]
GFGDPGELDGRRRALEDEFGVRVDYDPADLSSAEGVAGLIERTQSAFGSLDVLVNNAGIQHVAPLEAFPVERWDAVIALNLSAVFHGMRCAIPQMRERGWGRIINIASTHGLVASTEKVAYVAAKHGVVGATKVAALELANSGVTANAVCPGWVLTPLVERQIAERAAIKGTSVAEESLALLAEKQPVHSFTTPEQIGDLVVFLCSDAAATMTGAPVSIDGGWTAQ